MFAVIKIAGNQYKVREKDEIEVQKLDLKEGANVKVKDVYLISDDDASDFKLGIPYVSNTHVECQVIKHAKADKIRVFRYQAKKRHSRTYGHRQSYTVLKVLKISSVQKKSGSDTTLESAESVETPKKTVRKKVAKSETKSE